MDLASTLVGRTGWASVLVVKMAGPGLPISRNTPLGLKASGAHRGIDYFLLPNVRGVSGVSWGNRRWSDLLAPSVG